MLALLLSTAAVLSPTASPRRVLVVGGSGRVGASTVRWLDKLSRRDGQPLSLAVGGRSQTSFEAACRRLSRQGMDTSALSFIRVDVEDATSAAAAVAGLDLCVHTAGPFQQREDPILLTACVAAGVPYCDVCDEIVLSRNAKAMGERAIEGNVPAIVSCGIWPGVSALMAAEAKSRLDACEKIDLSFFTAGTGNAGPTIVSATFLLLCQEALVAEAGKLVGKEAWTSPREIDFGDGVGVRRVWLLDNPDVPTCAEALGVSEMSSRFGTDPGVWNLLFGAMKSLPRSLLADRQKMQSLSLFSEPIIRVVDRLVGATNAMRVDAYSPGDASPTLTLRCAHRDLEQCVGQATAAFGLELLQGNVPPGVWYPAELGDEPRANILERAREDAFVWEM